MKWIQPQNAAERLWNYFFESGRLLERERIVLPIVNVDVIGIQPGIAILGKWRN
jgi:hypothetical protein